MKNLDEQSESGTRQTPKHTACPASRHARLDTFANPPTLGRDIAELPAELVSRGETFLNSKTRLVTPRRAAPVRVLRRTVVGLCFVAILLSLFTTASPSVRAGEPVQIVTQPKSQTAIVGGSATFSVTATGDNPRYEWWYNGAPVPGATNATYTLDNVQNTDAGNYAVGVFNDTVWIASSVAKLTVVKPPAISLISNQTTDQNKTFGPLTVTIEDWSAPLGIPTLTASSANTNLVPNQNISIGGSGTNRTITIVPATNGFGLSYITINLSGANGVYASTAFALNVRRVNQPPQFVGEPPIIAQPYQLYTYTVNVTDPDPDDTLQVTAQGPSWLSFDPGTRVLSGTPPRGGPQGDAVTLTVTDGVTPAVVKQFTIYTADDIAITNATDIEIKRRALINYIWGPAGWPTNRVPTNIQPGFRDDEIYGSLYNEAGNLDRIDLYTVKMAYDLESKVYHFHPIHGNGRLFIYHAGHSWRGFVGDDVDGNNQSQNPGLVIPALLKEGFSVLAFDMPVYTRYPLPRVSVYWTSQILTLTSHPDMFAWLERPFRFFFEPVVVALNFVQDNYAYRSIYMTGFSGGGWMSSVYPSLDPRIDRSYAVAGSEPNYLRIGYEGLGDAEQDNDGFYRIANYKEFYVMSGYGLNRLQLQILNRYDACCHYGTRYTNWVDEVKSKVQQLGAGRYNFYSDTTHHEHKISTNALAVIMKSFPPTIDELSDITVAMNGGPQMIRLSGIGPASEARTAGLSVSAVSDNPGLTGELTVNYQSPDSLGSLSFSPQAGQTGVARILVTCKDAISEDATYTRAFTVTVKSLGIPPLVQWIEPADQTTVEPLQPVLLQVATSDTDGTVVQVEFRDGINSLGVVSNPPFSLLWSNATVGSHTLSAVATDDRGATATSATATITVLPLNQPPLVQWVSPTDGLTLDGSNPVTLEVTANDPDGTVTQVEFRDGTNSLGVVSNSRSFSMIRDHLGPGTHVLSAIVTDDRGGQTETPPVTITLQPANQAPTISWLNLTNDSVIDPSEAILLQAAAADPEGNLAHVEFLDGTNSLGVVSNPPYSLPWTNPTVGTHVLTAVATDIRGVAATDLITLTVAPTNDVPLTIQAMRFMETQSPSVTKSAVDPADSQFQFQIAGPVGRTVVVEASADFGNWMPISTNTLINGTAISADPESRNSAIRFYRVRLATQAP